MSRISNSAFVSKPAVVALIVAACVLSGCGRKGGLDLPPGASSAQITQSPQQNPESQYNTPGAAGAATSQGNLFDSTPNSNTIAVAPKGPNKRIFLDSLLD